MKPYEMKIQFIFLIQKNKYVYLYTHKTYTCLFFL